MRNPEQLIIQTIKENPEDFIQWPKQPLLLLPDVVRIKYHQYPDNIKQLLKKSGITPDSRSNGPAICSFLLAGGLRPVRCTGKGWSIHHIYDGKFPFGGRTTSTHAVKNGKYFTESAGLVALHPIADAIADEYSNFAWYLREKAFKRFGFDPDNVFKQANNND